MSGALANSTIGSIKNEAKVTVEATVEYPETVVKKPVVQESRPKKVAKKKVVKDGK